MRKTICLLICALALVSCEEKSNSYTYPPSGGGTTQPVYTPVAKFTYSIKQPLAVQFSDASTCARVVYDFGDGKTETFTKTYPTFTHQYASTGTYIVTATAYNAQGETNEKRETITIPAPKVYMTGIEYRSISYESKYYKAMCKDDDFFTTTWWNTSYTPILTTGSLPYMYTFKSPVLFDGIADDDYYTIYVYYNSSSSGDGTQVLKQDIMKADMLKYPAYHQLTNSLGTTTVRVHMQYE